MEYLQYYIILQTFLLLFQYTKLFSLESQQYLEMVFGSIFIIIFFGVFGSLLTNDFMNPNPTLLENSYLIALLFTLWFFLTKRITNYINSDSNGVIYN